MFETCESKADWYCDTKHGFCEEHLDNYLILKKLFGVDLLSRADDRKPQKPENLCKSKVTG